MQTKQEMRQEWEELIKARYDKTPSIAFWIRDYAKVYPSSWWQYLHIAFTKIPLEELNEWDKIYKYELKIPIRYNI